jgi:hypothetical protein
MYTKAGRDRTTDIGILEHPKLAMFRSNMATSSYTHSFCFWKCNSLLSEDICVPCLMGYLSYFLALFGPCPRLPAQTTWTLMLQNCLIVGTCIPYPKGTCTTAADNAAQPACKPPHTSIDSGDPSLLSCKHVPTSCMHQLQQASIAKRLSGCSTVI